MRTVVGGRRISDMPISYGNTFILIGLAEAGPEGLVVATENLFTRHIEPLFLRS